MAAESTTNGGQSIARQIKHDGQVYTAAELHPSLQRELRLVRACCDDWPINESAIQRLRSYFEKARIDADSSLLLAAAIPATWLAGYWQHRLPLVNLWGPPESAAPVLDLIRAIVRRPLAIAASSSAELFSLPEGLWPSIIVREPNQGLTKILLEASSTGARQLRSGKLNTLHCSAFIYTRWPLAAPALHIQLGTGDVRSDGLTSHQVERLGTHLGPRLLHYRLSNLVIRDGEIELSPELTPAGRLAARALYAGLLTAPDVWSQIGEVLVSLEQQDKIAASDSPAALVVEAMLVADHEAKTEIFFSEIAELVVTIAAGRGTPAKLSPKAVGTVVRNDLGLTADRQAPGYRIVFDEIVRKRVHDFGRTYAVPSMVEPHPNCPLCSAHQANGRECA